jgi:hypothetical protein
MIFKAPPQLVNVGMFGLASAARSSREPEAEAAEQTQSAAGHALLADQAIGLSQVKLRALIEGKFAAIGGTVQDAKVRKCTGSRFLVFI